MIRATVLAALLVLTACNNDSPNRVEPEPEPNTDGGYLEEYGGSSVVYDRIAAETDCETLQSEFEIAATNNDAAEPGTPQHEQTLGYMTAADDRMRALGCY